MSQYVRDEFKKKKKRCSSAKIIAKWKGADQRERYAFITALLSISCG